jgi:hypothetical protein
MQNLKIFLQFIFENNIFIVRLYVKGKARIY